MIANLLARVRRRMDGPELTPHQSWRVHKLCERLAGIGPSTDNREVWRDLEDALKIGLRLGYIFSIDAQEVVGITARGRRFIERA